MPFHLHVPDHTRRGAPDELRQELKTLEECVIALHPEATFDIVTVYNDNELDERSIAWVVVGWFDWTSTFYDFYPDGTVKRHDDELKTEVMLSAWREGVAALVADAIAILDQVQAQTSAHLADLRALQRGLEIG